MRPFDVARSCVNRLRPRARIVLAANDLRAAAWAGLGGISLDIASLQTYEAYQKAIEQDSVCLDQQPLHRLQPLSRVRKR